MPTIPQLAQFTEQSQEQASADALIGDCPIPEKPITSAPDSDLSSLSDRSLKHAQARHGTKAMFADRRGLWTLQQGEMAKLDAIDREIKRRDEVSA